ncbi:MAG: hypothetical protein AAF443_08330 [Chlamydiota bacterium]
MFNKDYNHNKAKPNANDYYSVGQTAKFVGASNVWADKFWNDNKNKGEDGDGMKPFIFGFQKGGIHREQKLIIGKEILKIMKKKNLI